MSVLFLAAAVVHAVLLTVLHALLRILKLSYDQYLINVVKHEFNLQRAVMAYNTLSAMQYELCKVPSPTCCGTDGFTRVGSVMDCCGFAILSGCSSTSSAGQYRKYSA